MNIQALNAKLLWDRRADPDTYDPTRDGKPKDRWVVHQMVRDGDIGAEHLQAAEWYESLVERSVVPHKWINEAVQGGSGSNGHEEALDNAKAAYGARQAVYRAIEFPTKPDQRRLTREQVRDHMAVFDWLFDGRKTLHAHSVRIGVSDGGRNQRATKRRIARVLDALADYHERIGEDKVAWALTR